MRVKVETIGEGLHPSEVVVAVDTTEGREQLAVDRRSLHDNSLEVGWPVGTHNGHWLVELPRETFRGAWRVWVARDQVIGDPSPERARA